MEDAGSCCAGEECGCFWRFFLFVCFSGNTASTCTCDERRYLEPRPRVCWVPTTTPPCCLCHGGLALILQPWFNLQQTKLKEMKGTLSPRHLLSFFLSSIRTSKDLPLQPCDWSNGSFTVTRSISLLTVFISVTSLFRPAWGAGRGAGHHPQKQTKPHLPACFPSQVDVLFLFFLLWTIRSRFTDSHDSALKD